jgi:hypothetical protein
MNVPRPAPWPELEEAAETLRRLESDYNAPFEKALAAGTGLVETQDADRRARATALREGTKPPAARAPKAQKALEETEEHRDALREAIVQQKQVIVELVGEHPEWEADADRLAVEARNAARTALDVAAQACERVANAEAVRTFLANPEGVKAKTTWNPVLERLPAPHGGGHTLVTALDALRHALDTAPERQTLDQHGRPLQVGGSLKVLLQGSEAAA